MSGDRERRASLAVRMWSPWGALWRRRRTVLIVWGVMLLAAAPFAANQNDRLSGGGFTDRNADSAAVDEAIEKGAYAGVETGVLAVVLVPRADARPGDLPAAIAEIERKVPNAGDIRVAPRERRTALESARTVPDRAVAIPLRFRGDETRAIDVARKLRPALAIEGSEPGEAAGGRVDVHAVGQGALWAAYQETADEALRKAEARGFPVIAAVLLLAFGSLAAAVLPLSLGLVAVVLTGAIIYGLSLAVEMSIFVSNVASMIGIGVAVDYSLFVLVRYREEIRAGRDPGDARAAAMATSGRAVVLAGLTVVTSLLALFVIDSPGMHSMAVGAIVVVTISVLATCALLPALIGLLGHRVQERGRAGRFVDRVLGRSDRPPEESFWWRWSRVVMQAPVSCVLAATAFLLIVAAPAPSLNVRNNASAQLDSKHEIRDAMRTVADLAGPGVLGPAQIRVVFPRGTVDDPANRETLRRVRTAMLRDPMVVRLGPPKEAKDQASVLTPAFFGVEPESQAARNAVDRLREDLPPAARGADVQIGGITATLLDFDRLVSNSLWQLVLLVLALAFVVLLVLLRSLLLPLKAMLMNILSVGAAYGVVVAVYQWGWLEPVIDRAPAMYPTQPFVLAVAFGLSMDYHVFLLSRIRERYEATGDNRQAVAEALATSASPITSAALIMVAVFLAFVSASAPSVQQIGLATAVAIAVDATIVRLVIVPAAMELLGKWNWWLPRPIERVLPRVEPAPQAPGAS